LGCCQTIFQQTWRNHPSSRKSRSKISTRSCHHLVISLLLLISLKSKQNSQICFSALQDNINIVKILGFTNNPSCIIMPLSLGDLSTLIQDKSLHSYSLADSINILLQLAAGIRAIHSIDVAHRDLKPKNVLLISREKVF